MGDGRRGHGCRGLGRVEAIGVGYCVEGERTLGCLVVIKGCDFQGESVVLALWFICYRPKERGLMH